MKKKILAISILMVSAFHLKAQTSYAAILALKDQTIQVVLNDDDDTSHYNPAIKAAMDKYWTFCKFKYITLAEYEQNKKEKTNIYLMPIRWNPNCYVDEISIIQGGGFQFKAKRYNTFYLYYKPLAYLELTSYGFQSTKHFHYIEDMGTFYIAKRKGIVELLPNIIQQWQWENEIILKHPELSEKRPVEVTSFLVDQSDVKQLKQKMLLIDSASFKEMTVSSIASIYKYQFKVVPIKEIFTAIQNQDENICYLYNGSRAQDCSFPISIYSAKGGKRIYSPRDYYNRVTVTGMEKAKDYEGYLTALMSTLDK